MEPKNERPLMHDKNLNRLSSFLTHRNRGKISSCANEKMNYGKPTTSGFFLFADVESRK